MLRVQYVWMETSGFINLLVALADIRVSHMVTKQTQGDVNGTGVVTRCFYEEKQLAGNDAVVFLLLSA